MTRTITKLLAIVVFTAAAVLIGNSTGKAFYPWSGCCGTPYMAGYGYGGYGFLGSTYDGFGFYGAAYSPWYTGYWPSYTGYWPGYYGGCCGGGCGVGCCSSGCCGVGACGLGCCGSTCGACGVCDAGCAAGGSCGAAPAGPPGKLTPTPDGNFQPRPSPPYDDSSRPAPGSTGPGGRRPASPEANPPAGDAGAGGATDGGTATPPRAYKRDNSAPETSPKEEFQKPKDTQKNNATKTGASETERTFEGPENRTSNKINPQADKKAPVKTPDDQKGDNKKTSGATTGGPVLDLQDRPTAKFPSARRPVLGRIAHLSVPVPQRIGASSGEWALLPGDRVARN